MDVRASLVEVVIDELALDGVEPDDPLVVDQIERALAASPMADSVPLPAIAAAVSAAVAREVER
jgi:hypothetical protein